MLAVLQSIYILGGINIFTFRLVSKQASSKKENVCRPPLGAFARSPLLTTVALMVRAAASCKAGSIAKCLCCSHAGKGGGGEWTGHLVKEILARAHTLFCRLPCEGGRTGTSNKWPLGVPPHLLLNFFGRLLHPGLHTSCHRCPPPIITGVFLANV